MNMKLSNNRNNTGFKMSAFMSKILLSTLVSISLFAQANDKDNLISDNISNNIKSQKEIAGSDQKNNNDEYIYIPFSMQFIPDSMFIPGRRVKNNLVIGIVASDSHALEGAAISSVGHLAYDYVTGHQISGAFNISAGQVSGGQLAGAFNAAAREISGYQIAGALNISGGNINGPQLAGALNLAAREVNGLQLSGAVNIAGSNVNGAQISGSVNIAGKNVNGAQISGSVNIAGKNVNGAQISGSVNIAGKNVNGAQIGVVNAAGGRVNGAQIGVVNLSEYCDVPIGLISILKNGKTRGAMWMDDLLFYNIGIKHGNEKFFNIYSLGTHNLDDLMFSIGYGLHFPRDKIFFEIDSMASSIYQLERNSNYGNLLAKIRFGIGYELQNHLSLIAGVSYNYYTKFNTKYDPKPDSVLYSSFPWSDDNNKHWPGFYVGIEF